jgi:hypothetical protein
MKITWMKLAIFLIGLFLCGTTGNAGQSTDTPEPEAFLPQASYQFEPVAEGSRVVHEFILQNQGTAPLEIIKISTG